jgi:hypothetical protein
MLFSSPKEVASNIKGDLSWSTINWTMHETTSAQTGTKKSYSYLYSNILICVVSNFTQFFLCKKCSSYNLIEEIHIDDHLKGTLGPNALQ